MQVWAIGIVCFYVALGVFNWVTGLHWLAEFSLPLSIAGGIGLAIASNSTTAALPADSDPQKESPPSSPIAESTAEAAAETSPTQEASISFTINKNLRP